VLGGVLAQGRADGRQVPSGAPAIHAGIQVRVQNHLSCDREIAVMGRGQPLTRGTATE
jgi:hypothetical protein